MPNVETTSRKCSMANPTIPIQSPPEIALIRLKSGPTAPLGAPNVNIVIPPSSFVIAQPKSGPVTPLEASDDKTFIPRTKAALDRVLNDIK